MRLLRTREWLGNIRELENWIARYVILGANDDCEQESRVRRSLPISIEARADGYIPLKLLTKKAVLEMETELIHRVLRDNHWNRRKAAEILEISYRTLIYKIRETGLEPKESRR